ncbi:NACHT domain-containing protein [Actinoplanes sp. NPDC051513]|uniref:NACHT domain-containing protein n=1 Tax=Actinoplanes sp. NPDC051513 TaxID=3363908 RepID=UPI0037A5154D
MSHLSGIEPAIGRAAGKALSRAGSHLITAHRRRRLADEARTLVPTAIAAGTLAELSGSQSAQLARFAESPNFEDLALQLVLAGGDPEALSAIRAELRQSLRHAVDLAPAQMVGVTDVLLDALIASLDPPIAAGVPDRTQVAVRAHVAAAAARNGRLLAGLRETAEIHEAAERLRGQVRALRSQIRLPHTGLNRAVDWASLYVTPVLRARESEVAVEPGELLEPGRRSAILGAPGAGKSTLISKLAFDLAGDPQPRVPFILIARDHVEALRQGGKTLVHHLADAARSPFGVELPADGIEYLLLNGRAAVFVDGLDEITDLAVRQRLVELVDGFAELYPLTPVLATSREVGYDAVALRADRYAIAPFTDEQVADYADRWFRNDDATAPDERRSRIDGFLRDSTALDDLRRNPLMLSLLCAVYTTDRYLPRNRAQVYERCAVLMFDRWDAMRGIPMPVRFQGHVRGAVQQLAWEMFTADGSTLTLGRTRRVLRRFLESKRFDVDEAEALADSFLEFCAGRSWLLTELGTDGGEPVLGFTHRTFLEFFTAEHVVRRSPSPEAVWAVLAAHLSEADWAVVSQLALQLIERNVDDGGESTVELALAAWPSPDPDALAAFLARATAHLELSGPVLRAIVARAVERTRELPVPERYLFWPDAFVRDRGTRCDDAFVTLLYDSLDANLAGLRRHVGAALAGDDDHLRYLATNLDRPRRSGADTRVAFWRALQNEIWDENAFGRWLRREPYGALRLLSLEPELAEEWFATFGPAPLYTGDVYERGFTLPGALLSLATRPGDPGAVPVGAHRLRDLLIAAKTPWLPADRWKRESHLASVEVTMWIFEFVYRDTWPDDPGDQATILVLGLPYLETVAKGQVVIVTDLEQLRSITAARAGREPHEPLRLAEPHRRFLEDWVAGRISVLG